MQDDQNNSTGGGDKGAPRFNYFWIYGIIAVLLIGLNFFWTQPQAKSIDWNKLEKIAGHPYGVSLEHPEPETITHFMERAMKVAIEKGKIEEITIKQ